jgi:hypothetical protein
MKKYVSIISLALTILLSGLFLLNNHKNDTEKIITKEEVGTNYKIFNKDFITLSREEKNVLEKYSESFRKKISEEGHATPQDDVYYSAQYFYLMYLDKTKALIVPPPSVTGSSPHLVSLLDLKTLGKTFGRGPSFVSEKYAVFFVNQELINFYKAGDVTFSKKEAPFTLSYGETLVVECDFTGPSCEQDLKIVGDSLVIGIYKENKTEGTDYQKNIKIREIKIDLSK